MGGVIVKVRTEPSEVKEALPPALSDLVWVALDTRVHCEDLDVLGSGLREISESVLLLCTGLGNIRMKSEAVRMALEAKHVSLLPRQRGRGINDSESTHCVDLCSRRCRPERIEV